MEQFRKLLEKKKAEGKHLDPMEKESKMSMLKALKQEMGGMMKNDLSPENMKKVTVASNDKQGLAAGLDKAKSMLGQEPQSEAMSSGGLVGDKSGPSGADESAESEQKEDVNDPAIDGEGHSADLSGDSHDEEVESHMGAYLKESSKENLENLMAALQKKKDAHQE